MMLIPKNFGLNWLPDNTDNERWGELLRLAIMDILHNHCPVPQPVYEVNHLIDTEFDFDDESREKAKDVIEELGLQLKPIIERNGPWMMYNTISISGNYVIQQLGDYRILEWEQGRGRVIDEKETEEDEFIKALDYTWGQVKQIPNIRITTPRTEPTWCNTPSKAKYLECNTLINGPGHSSISKPDTVVSDKWDMVIAEDGDLFETINDIVILANWETHGICLLPVERGTIIEYIYRNDVGYLTVV